MKTKKMGIIITVILIIALLLGYIISYANTGTTIYVNLTPTDANNIGYGIGNPKNAGGGNYIWNLATYDTNNVSDKSAKQRNLYCIKANYGDTWNENESKIVAYNLSYDFQNDREELLKKLVDNSSDADDVVKKILDPESGTYREILWILDNAYIEGETNRDQFIKDVLKIQYDEEYKTYYYQDGDNYEEYTTLITDTDIKAVQRAAIWYYTNYVLDNQSSFNKKDSTDWLTITTDGGNTYNQLSDITGGAERNKQAERYYKYLIEEAAKNADLYTAENKYKISEPAKVNTTGLAKDGEKYILQTKRIDSKYRVGPIKIDKNNNSLYDIEIKLTNNAGKEIPYTYVNSNGESLGNVTIKDLVGKTEGFYISVERDAIDIINIAINISYEVTQKTLWLNGSEDANTIKLN